MIKGTDYVDGGWFGAGSQPGPDEYVYLVTVKDALGETQYDPAFVVSRKTLPGQINKLSYLFLASTTQTRNPPPWPPSLLPHRIPRLISQ